MRFILDVAVTIPVSIAIVTPGLLAGVGFLTAHAFSSGIKPTLFESGRAGFGGYVVFNDFFLVQPGFQEPEPTLVLR